jgi:hypothetical protein
MKGAGKGNKGRMKVPSAPKKKPNATLQAILEHITEMQGTGADPSAPSGGARGRQKSNHPGTFVVQTPAPQD